MAQARVPIKLILAREAYRVLGLVAPRIAANWAYRQWYATRRFRESEHDMRWRKQAQLQMLDYVHGKVAVYRWGDENKPVVLCVHGIDDGPLSQLGLAHQALGLLPAALQAGHQDPHQ